MEDGVLQPQPEQENTASIDDPFVGLSEIRL
jgi:hypothetical protein